MNLRSGRLPWRRLLTAALAAAAIFLYWSHVSDRGAREVARSPAIADQRTPDTRGWGAGVGFADQHRLDEHYEKHGAAFGRITRQDYLHQAQLHGTVPMRAPAERWIEHLDDVGADD